MRYGHGHERELTKKIPYLFTDARRYSYRRCRCIFTNYLNSFRIFVFVFYTTKLLPNICVFCLRLFYIESKMWQSFQRAFAGDQVNLGLLCRVKNRRVDISASGRCRQGLPSTILSRWTKFNLSHLERGCTVKLRHLTESLLFVAIILHCMSQTPNSSIPARRCVCIDIRMIQVRYEGTVLISTRLFLG